MTFQKNMSLGARKEKLVKEAGQCELDEGRSLLKIKCKLWIYKGVSKKLL